MASRYGPRRRVRWARTTAAVVLALGAATVPGGTAWALAGSESWAAELSVGGGDDANVVARDGAIRLASTSPRTTSTGPAPAEGELLLPPRRVSAVTDRVAADATADEPAGSDVVVAVRGLRSDGSWSQWTTATATTPALLPEATLQVQVRITLVASPGGTSPSLRRLWLTADRAPAASPPPASNAVSARVYATRVGLVGNRTANGHRVVTDDRFVALPSRRGLAPDGTGDYTVQVCTDAGRCSWAPVWDLGPWNTRDDYWSTTDTRENNTDLPRGVPEAQAAALDGYDRGRDDSGRKVSNPAGIDLADGTFRDDLGLRDNAWVQVTYLWTGTGGRSGTARSADPVTVRASAAADGRDVGVVAPHARVPVQCATPTRAPAGRTGASPDRWLRIGPDRYVPADALEVSDVPAC
jgi:hypothetical protein